MAVARKLVTIAYLMLKNNEPYRYAKPDLMRQEVLELGSCGTKPSEAGSRKASLRSAGPCRAGCRLCTAGLPSVVPPDQLPNGEQTDAQAAKARRLRRPVVQRLYQPTEDAKQRHRPGATTTKGTGAARAAR